MVVTANGDHNFYPYKIILEIRLREPKKPKFNLEKRESIMADNMRRIFSFDKQILLDHVEVKALFEDEYIKP